MTHNLPLISHDTPRALELLEAAHGQLLDGLLPSTQGDQRYSALMVANALSIAIREFRQERTTPTPVIDTGAGPELCRRLRDGTVEDLFDDELLSRLEADVNARLRVSNPKRLTP